MAILLRRGFIPDVAVSTLLLDPGILTATNLSGVSSRKLRSAYSANSGKCMNVLNTGGGNQDIGFTVGNDFDQATMDSFIGATNTGTVGKWYDQAVGGGGGVYNNTTTANTPIIRASNVDNVINNRIAPVGQGGGATALFINLLIPGLTAQPYTVAYVAKFPSTGTAFQVVGDFNHASFSAGTTTTAWSFDAGVSYPQGSSDTSVHGFVCIVNSTSSQLYVDGVQVGSTGNAGPTAPSGELDLWNFSGNNVQIAEFLVFSGAMGAPDIATLHSSWQSYWGTP